MIKLKTKNLNQNKELYLKSFLGNIKIYLIDKKIKISNKIKIKIINNTIFFKGPLGKLNLKYINIIYIKKKKDQILISLNLQKKINKKSILNLYFSLIKLKIKGILQGFKFNLILEGIGYKTFIKNNKLILKLGFSHNIIINIPKNIKILFQNNKISLFSNDWFLLTQYIHYIKKFKKPEPYKGKGILLKNENILRKEGKKNKK